MEWLTHGFNVLQVLIFFVLGINILYLFVFAVASLFRIRIIPSGKNESYRKIAVLIPGYKEDNVIIDVADDATKQNYPKDKFDVIVIADSFADSTIESLKALFIRLIEVSFENSTKARALNKAMSILPDDYDIAVILDADNLMAPDFLMQINNFFAAQPVIAVQGHRVAKNMNTSFAILDAVSEEITNQLFRKGQRVMGFSSSIIGSGVAFDYIFFKNIMLKIDAIGGYDKELEMRILRGKHKIYYLPDAYVYDEKVQTAAAFSNQRRRWLSSQLHYVRTAFSDAVKLLFTTGNLDYFNKVFQWTLLPRVIILSLVFVLIPILIILEQCVFHPYLTIGWISLFITCILSFIMLVPRKFYNLRTLKAVVSLPWGAWLMFKNFFTLKGANRRFIHTEHGVNDPKSN